MNLLLRETLKRSGVWEEYKLKHNIVERAALSLHDFTDAAVQELATEIQMNPGDELMMYRLDQGMDPYDGEDHDEAHYQEWLPDYLEGKVSDTIGYIWNNFTEENGEIIIYREITAPADWVEQGGLTTRGLGVYWSWDEHAAEAHWGNFSEGQVKYLLQGSVSYNEVNWVSTITKNAHSQSEDEKEVELKEGSTIRLLGVYRYDGDRNMQPVDIGGMAGKSLPV